MLQTCIFFVCASFCIEFPNTDSDFGNTDTDCGFYNNVTCFVIGSGTPRLREQQHSFGVSCWA